MPVTPIDVLPRHRDWGSRPAPRRRRCDEGEADKGQCKDRFQGVRPSPIGRFQPCLSDAIPGVRRVKGVICEKFASEVAVQHADCVRRGRVQAAVARHPWYSPDPIGIGRMPRVGARQRLEPARGGTHPHAALQLQMRISRILRL